MLSARDRLARQKSRPLLVELHRALSRLSSVLTVMNTGAHPDDEQNEMLAVFRLAEGMRVVVACSTRGEGGQNSLGPERSGALGVLRTREMEGAAKVIDADIAWLGHGPDDPVHDFGFSKNGKDTLGRWGYERTLERLVRAYRSERPDIVIPTFLDVPGQHGHHRAMTEAAETAIEMAADPNAFPEHAAEGLKPWRVSKYYLPAWSGGGSTYDDEVPPPNATVAVTAPESDPATGAAYAEIGEWSRTYHASQGMGHWFAEPQTVWPLHLKLGGNGPEHDVRDHLPRTLADLGNGLAPDMADRLRGAQQRIDAAIAAFPNRKAIITALAGAAELLEGVVLDRGQVDAIGHRIERKRREIDAALMVAAGVDAIAWAEPRRIHAGGETVLNVHVRAPAEMGVVQIEPNLPQWISAGEAVRDGSMTRIPLQVGADAPLTGAYPAGFSSLGGNGIVSVTLVAEIGGRKARSVIDLEEPMEVAPKGVVSLEPDAVIVAVGQAGTLDVTARVEGGVRALALSEAAGITVARTANGFSVDTGAVTKGRHRLSVLADGEQAYRQTEIAYPHIGRAFLATPQHLDVLALELKLPDARVGYVGGGSDRVGLWLGRMGIDVIELDQTELAGDLSRFTTIVIGTFAFGLRPDLLAAAERLRNWVEAGGHLVTLYHRPTDGWIPDKTPPRRLAIGSPSLRWRVTNPAAAVEVLVPDHKLLTGPNVIGPEDWAGWDKERGLYFASEWDPAYEPLLAMHDAGEAPLKGSLLSAPIGKGRHTHTSLVLHHQMDRLVPGAFRLMANLLQPA